MIGGRTVMGSHTVIGGRTVMSSHTVIGGRTVIGSHTVIDRIVGSTDVSNRMI